MSRMTPKEIVDLAIRREIGAAAFYRKVAGMQKKHEIRDLFEAYAQEEDKHKELLENLDLSDIDSIHIANTPNLRIAEHLAEVAAGPDMTYKEALLLGMQKEKKAYRLYIGLTESTDDPRLKKLFEKLAIEEAKHKLYFETLYDDYLLEDEEQAS